MEPFFIPIEVLIKSWWDQLRPAIMGREGRTDGASQCEVVVEASVAQHHLIYGLLVFMFLK